ncbi:MAG: IS110 family transposase [Lentisphaerae bacterium]|nr:IS110 family transposase [Lentisphaerota bacterium]
MSLDVHDDMTQFAVMPAGESQVQHEDTCHTAENEILGRIRRLRKKWPLVVLYEAGRTGYWLYRKLRGKRIPCIVIDPGSIPDRRRRGNKTDRLDARKNAEMARSNLLRAVGVPDEETQGLRDLLRLHKALSSQITAIKNRITAQLARYNQKCPTCKTPFCGRWRAWLVNQVRLPTADAQAVLEAHYRHLLAAEAELGPADDRLEEATDRPRWRQACRFLQAIHGVGPMVALAILTSMQTPRRFAGARQFMSFVGLVPDVERSAGKGKGHPRITRHGDELTRWVLIQAAWQYVRCLHPSPAHEQQLAELPAWLAERIRQMETRLRKRYYYLTCRKCMIPGKAVVAIAREMAGWLWAICQELQEHGELEFAGPEQMPSFGPAAAAMKVA